MNYFKTNFIETLKQIILEEPICSVRSRMAQTILKHYRVTDIRKKEPKFTYFPKQYLKALRP